MRCGFSRLLQLYAGLILYGVSSSLQILAGLGLDPWDVFHQGISARSASRSGRGRSSSASLVLLLWIPLRQKPGIGTVSNVVLVVVDITSCSATCTAPRLELRVPDHRRRAERVATGAYIGAGLGPGRATA